MQTPIKLCDTIACLLVAGVVTRIARFLLLSGVLSWQGAVVLGAVSIAVIAFAFFPALEIDMGSRLSAICFGAVLALIFN